MSKICPDCQHYVIGSINPFGADTPRSCALGHNDELNKWWADNGHKHRGDEHTEMECFEKTEFARLSDKLLDSLDKLATALK